MSIKIDKAIRLTRHLPRARREILASIPATLTARITSGELAQVMDALNEHWHKAIAHAEAEAVAEGVIWSQRDNALLLIGDPWQPKTEHRSHA